MAEVTPFLGHIEFGAGENCPCGTGDRMISYRKIHQNWGADAAGSVFPRPGFRANLTITASHFFAEPPAVRDGSYAINRFSGQVDSHIFVVATDVESFVRATENSVTYSRPGWGLSLITFGGEYTFPMLSEDLQAVIDSPMASLALVPFGSQADAGYAETIGGIDPIRNTSRRWDPETQPAIGDPPSDGRIVLGAPHPFALNREGGVPFATPLSSFEWRGHMLRQRVHLAFIGFFSIEREDQLLNTGAPLPTIRKHPKEYFYLTRGLYDFLSPPISQEDALSATHRVTYQNVIRIGDVPPEGVPYKEVIGVGSAGSSC